MEEYNPAIGQVIAWVQIPTLSHTSDTILYMFYGNPSITSSQQNSTAVWDANYQGVYHLANVGTGTATDSTVNSNNAPITSVLTASGQIDGAGSFNGVSSYMQLPAADFSTFLSLASDTPNYSATFGTWFKTASSGIIFGQTSGGTEPGASESSYVPALYLDTAGKLRASMFWHGSNSNQIVTASSYNDNNWHFAVDTYSSGTETHHHHLHLRRPQSPHRPLLQLAPRRAPGQLHLHGHRQVPHVHGARRHRKLHLRRS